MRQEARVVQLAAIFAVSVFAITLHGFAQDCPEFVGACNTTGYTYDVAVSGSYAYLANEEAGLRVIDISNPASPIEVGYIDTWDSALDVAVSRSYAYVAAWVDGLRVVDVSDPANPVEVGYGGTLLASWGVDVADGYAYVSETIGMGVYRECFYWIFFDSFESGDTAAWSSVGP